MIFDIFCGNKLLARELSKASKDLLPIYYEVMNDFNTDLLYQSEIHGVNHNIRVSIFTLLIASSLDVSKEDFRILLEAAKYHDVGRCNDKEDYIHGCRSCDKIGFLRSKYNHIEMSYLEAIIEAHSIPDSIKDRMIRKYDLKDVNRYHRLLDILKDSDALDRVRTDDLDTSYLRTKRAKELVDFSYELYDKYSELIGNGNKEFVKILKRNR